MDPKRSPRKSSDESTLPFDVTQEIDPALADELRHGGEQTLTQIDFDDVTSFCPRSASRGRRPPREPRRSCVLARHSLVLPHRRAKPGRRFASTALQCRANTPFVSLLRVALAFVAFALAPSLGLSPRPPARQRRDRRVPDERRS